jgi:co-chaperonin GroES (HSP10)
MAKSKAPILRPLKSNIIFQFVEDAATLSDGQRTAKGFEEYTDWGFRIVDSKSSTSSPRWGIVVAVGPEVKEDIYPGRKILIENLKWTEGVKHDGVTYWMTSEDVILAVDEAEDR